jgi:regulator of cell morphogenesis and NO signaling
LPVKHKFMIMTQQETYLQQTVSAIVRKDYRAADVFKRHGINYCCGGAVLLQEACAAKGVDPEAVAAEIGRACTAVLLPASLQYASWRTDFLIDYIRNIHHESLRVHLPLLEGSLLSFAGSHQKQHPVLGEVVEAFQALSSLLEQQNRQEEETIFPYISQLDSACRGREAYGSLFVRTLRKPLRELEKEQVKVGSLLEKLRALTGGYAFDEKACTNHRVVYQKLRDFDQDLVQHKHLEHNVLFPKALAMEQQLLQQ